MIWARGFKTYAGKRTFQHTRQRTPSEKFSDHSKTVPSLRSLPGKNRAMTPKGGARRRGPKPFLGRVCPSRGFRVFLPLLFHPLNGVLWISLLSNTLERQWSGIHLPLTGVSRALRDWDNPKKSLRKFGEVYRCFWNHITFNRKNIWF